MLLRMSRRARSRRWRRVALLAAACLLSACGTTPVRPIVATSTASFVATPAPTASATAAPACTPLSAVDAWPLAQRAAQLVVAPALHGNAAALGGAISQGVGGILILGAAASDLRSQLSRAQAQARIPMIVMADQEGGGVQRLGSLVGNLPWPREMVSQMTSTGLQAAAARVAAQMKALGVTMNLAPLLDLDAGDGPNDRDVIGLRSFSAGASVTTTYALAFARGMQQGGEVPVVKHFPGIGGATGNTELGPATTQPIAALRQTGLLPYQAAIAAGLPAVMVSHASIPGLSTAPASLSSAAITGLLREQLGFRGLVLTDSLSAGAVYAAGYDLASAAVQAISAGADMLLFGSTLNDAQTALLSPAGVAASVSSMVSALTAAVRDGRLPASRFDDAVLHVLAVKGINPCA